MSGLRPILALLTLLAFAAPTLALEPREERQTYAPDDQARKVCGLHDEDNGGCFLVEAGETSVTLLVEDLTGLPVTAAYSFQSVEGRYLGTDTFCGGVTVALPPEAYWVDVFPSPVAALGVMACSPLVTQGTITATFA